MAKASFDALKPILEKFGARNSKSDAEKLNEAHDAVASLADSIHCCADGSPAQKAALIKIGAKRSRATMALLKVAHDALNGAGAACPKDNDIIQEDDD